MKKNIQDLMFEQIKVRLPKGISLGNSVSEILSISPDAAYRRYRGETPVTMSEASKLCNHFDLSFDALAQLGDGKVMFSYPPLNTFDFELRDLLGRHFIGI